MKRRFYNLFLIGLVVIIFAVFLLQNPKFIVHSAWYQRAYDFIGYQIVSHQRLTTLLPEQDRCVNSLLRSHLSAIDLAKLKADKVKVLTAREAVAAAKQPVTAGNYFLVIANTPYDYQGKTMAQQLAMLEQSTQAAQKLGAKMVVDASNPDALRVTARGFATLQLLKEAGIMRMVIFDGGHHLVSLALDPELVIMPVTDAQDGKRYVNHAYTRDAMAETEIMEIARQMKVNTVLVEVPRLTSVVKTKRTMGELAKQALLAAGAQKDVVATLSGNMNTVYDLAGVETAVRAVRAADGTILMSLNLNKVTNPNNAIKQIKNNLALLKGKPREVYVSVLYGDSTFRTLPKQMIDPIALNNAVQRFAANRGMDISIVNIPYSSWDLYWSKVINYWQGITTDLLVPQSWFRTGNE